jgi:tetratricopeptide (TPR) repeat protein
MALATRAAAGILGLAFSLFAQLSPDELIAAGHWKRARSIVEARFQEAPSNALNCFYLSQIRNAFGDRSSPLPLAEKAVALDGGTARYHRQLAEVIGVTAQHANLMQQLFLARRFRKELDTALALDPGDLQAQRDLLEFYLLAPGIAGGDTRKATATVERISQLDAAEGFLASARIAEFQKQPGEMEAALRRAVEAAPSNYKARIALAQFYLNASPPRLDDAADQARRALQLDGSRVDAYAALAVVDASRDDWDALDSLLATAAAAVPDDLTPYYRAAEKILAQGRNPARAARYLKNYLQQPPEGNEPTAADARAKLTRGTL